jgi:hypothetical protein
VTVEWHVYLNCGVIELRVGGQGESVICIPAWLKGPIAIRISAFNQEAAKRPNLYPKGAEVWLPRNQ